MAQIHQSRKSTHPAIETVWATQNTADGTYLATPDGSWDFIVNIAADGSKSMMIAGQATRPMEVPYTRGTASVVISMAAGTFLPDYPSDILLDSVKFLDNADASHFLLCGRSFAFPTYDNAEVLISELIAQDIVQHNSVVGRSVSGSPKALSTRATQRHFSETTGMTKKYLSQIQRAQQAVRLLQAGKTPAEAAIEAGYTDQSHMARSLKRIMATKPSSVDDIHKL